MADIPIPKYSLDPRKRFKESVAAKSWADITASSVFASAIEAALVACQTSLPVPNDMGTAAANDYRMQGARRFAEILGTLTDSVEPKTQRRMPTLNHNV